MAWATQECASLCINSFRSTIAYHSHGSSRTGYCPAFSCRLFLPHAQPSADISQSLLQYMSRVHVSGEFRSRAATAIEWYLITESSATRTQTRYHEVECARSRDTQFAMERPDRLRVMGVPEAFNIPVMESAEVEFVEAPGGTGAMLAALQTEPPSADVCLALTECVVAAIEQGQSLRILGP